MHKNPKWATKSPCFTTAPEVTLPHKPAHVIIAGIISSRQTVSQSRIFIYPMCSTGCSKEQMSTAFKKHWVCLCDMPVYVANSKHCSLELRQFPISIYLFIYYFSDYLTFLLKLRKSSLLLHHSAPSLPYGCSDSSQPSAGTVHSSGMF